MTIEEIQEGIKQGQGKIQKVLQIEQRCRVLGLSPCWIITSHLRNPEYAPNPQIAYRGKKVRLTRLVKELEGYEIPKSMTASHICETETDNLSYLCINVDHIVIESLKDNLKRSKRRPAALRKNMEYARTFTKKYRASNGQ